MSARIDHAQFHARSDSLPPVLGKYAEQDEREWQRAFEDALRGLRSIPDPAKFAGWLEPRHREALRTAWRSCEGWRVHPEYVRELRLLGLVEVSGKPSDPGGLTHQRNYLGVFGMKVRRVVIGEDF
jgi:hypothetical protein